MASSFKLPRRSASARAWALARRKRASQACRRQPLPGHGLAWKLALLVCPLQLSPLVPVMQEPWAQQCVAGVGLAAGVFSALLPPAPPCGLRRRWSTLGRRCLGLGRG